MPGVSLTLLSLPRAEEESPFTADEILSFLDEKTGVAAWEMAVKLTPSHGHEENNQAKPGTGPTEAGGGPKLNRSITVSEPRLFVQVVEAACEALKAAEPEITKMDQVGGDGDCGTTLKNGAEGVLKMISDGRINGANLIEDVGAIADAVGDQMDGTSGALYSCVCFWACNVRSTLPHSGSSSLLSRRLCTTPRGTGRR
jgi:triose/dihydroxyacetone kinase / FAD-AMP lyase (cyclizing)